MLTPSLYNMKNYLAGLLFVVLSISCTSKKENEKQVAKDDYSIFEPVGTNENGVYTIMAHDTVTAKWKSRLEENLRLSNGVSISHFEIVKTSTLGETEEDAYLLLSHTSDNLSAIALNLNLKGDKFYIDTAPRGGVNVSGIIMCKSHGTSSDCKPGVVLHNKSKRLICLSTNDCEKVNSEIIW